MAGSEASKPASSISVRFWGTRGSIACPGPGFVRYGGNTPCVETRCGEHTLILDAGSGIRPLGNALVRSNHASEFDIFLSHGHIDHVVGLPFFAPLYDDNKTIRIWGGNFQATGGVEEVVRKLMSYPLFPLQIEAVHATLEFHDFSAGDTLNPRPGVKIRTAPLQHPGGATGFCVEYGGRTMTYVTDVEMGDGAIDPALLGITKDSGLVIIDSTYTDEELPARIGWGHSTWRQAIRLADAANARKLCLFHHDPDHDDAFMDKVQRDAQAARPGTVVASEGLKVDI